MALSGKEILLIIINVIFPPLAVYMMTGCGADLCINILLTVLGYIPGHIHGFWIMYKKHKAEKLYGPGGYAYQGNGRFVPATQPAMVAPAAGYGTM